MKMTDEGGRPVSATRDRVIAAIYETVVRPELYESFLDAWAAHMESGLAEADGSPPGRLEVDPELGAHFQRAYEILEQIGRRSPQAGLEQRTRDAKGFAVLATADGRILAASATAARTLGANGLDGLQDGLTGPARTALRRFCHALERGEAPGPLVLTTGDTPRHLLVQRARTAAGEGATAALLTIEALDHQWNDGAEALLVESFALSRAEVAVLRALLSGRTLREIAADTGRSEHTIRNQMKSVLAKTGAPSQVDLVRLVAFLINSAAEREQQVAPRGLRGRLLTLAGRRVELFTDGPEDGRPVLFLHGMLDGLAAPLHLRDRFRAAGYRLIAPARPGFGRSEPVGRPEDALDIVVAQVEALIGRMDLKAPILLGHMAGALYGHVLASRLRGRVAGMVAVSGAAPIRRLSQLSSMAPHQRIVAYTARFTPALLPPLLRAGIAQIDSKDIEGFMTALYPPGSHEAAVIRRLDLARIIQAGYRFSVTQGHIGFATDSHHIVRDWSRHIDPSAPVLYLHGARDPVVPRGDVEAFLQDLPGAECQVLGDAGQLSLYERPDAVFEALARF